MTPLQDICYFLYSLRAALQKRRHACASISIPSYLCDDSWGGPGWVQKLGFLSDACISLSAFTGLCMPPCGLSPCLTAILSKPLTFGHLPLLPWLCPHPLPPVTVGPCPTKRQILLTPWPQLVRRE